MLISDHLCSPQEGDGGGDAKPIPPSPALDCLADCRRPRLETVLPELGRGPDRSPRTPLAATWRTPALVRTGQIASNGPT
jgi:hypothetical protein